MPCYDPRANEALDQEREDNSNTIKVLANRLNEATRLLCTLTDHLDAEFIEDESLKRWVLRHRAEDIG